MAYLVVILSAYVFVLKEAGKISSNQLSTFNGRTYIWGIVLDHWNDVGSIFGYSGAYNLYNYSMENSVLFVIYHAHNMVLQLLWDWGIFGLVVGAIVLLVFLKTYLRVQWGGFILMTLILFEGLIEPVLSFSVQSSEMFFLLIYLKYIFAPVALSENSKV
jgi:O-antigen ligase